MIHFIFQDVNVQDVMFFGILFAFFITCISLKLSMEQLPMDGGRKYAVNGALSHGKPRGAGLVFIFVFTISVLLFFPFSTKLLIYIILLLCAMISGYLDDRSNTPWGEYLKGVIDLVISFTSAYTFWSYHSSDITLAIFNKTYLLPAPMFIMLATILIWTSINVTNCSDGVDGLCGTLSMITLISIFIFMHYYQPHQMFSTLILLFIACLLGYLWFNATPSKLLMGDAGSRAIGLFISFAILNTKSPFLFVPLAFVLIFDGGLGLLKVFLLRFLHIPILKTTITPLHDNFRKNYYWSDPQVVFRFSIIQTLISFIYLFLVLRFI